MIRSSQPRNDESGVALLVVLLAITLLTVVVVEFTYSAEVETHLAFSGRNTLQATYLARSAVNVAELLLIAQRQMLKKDVDSEQDAWARPFPPMPVGDGSAMFRIRDETRLLNLNDLAQNGRARTDEGAVNFAKDLFQSHQVGLDVLNAIVDWIDSDDRPAESPAGAEQPYYLTLDPPVRIRNGPLLTMRELRLVRGVTPAIFAQLESFATVLPQQGFKININTAPAEVLDALIGDSDLAARVIARRAVEPLEDLAAVKNILGLDDALLKRKTEGFVTFGSSFFRIDGIGTVNDVSRSVTTIVKRTGLTIKRLTWMSNAVSPSLTSQPPSDFLQALPPLGGTS